MTNEERPVKPQVVKGTDWFGVIIVALVIVVMSYALFQYYNQFVLNSQMALSTNVNDWGVFGDYVGGIVNPIVSFAALVFLYRAYILQRRELAETKKALQQSSKEAELQTKESVKQTDISIYTALINSLVAALHVKNTQLDLMNEEVKHLAAVSGSTYTFSGKRISLAAAEQEIKRLAGNREGLEDEIAQIMTRMETYEEFLSVRFNATHGKGAGTLPAIIGGGVGTVTPSR